MDDDRSGIRWMSYAELAETRGISRASATRLAFRRKWDRQGSNDKTARVAVPISEISPKRPDTHDDILTTGDAISHDNTRFISALEAQIAAKDAVIGSKDALISALQAQIAGKEAQVDAVQAHIGTMADKLRDAEAQLAQIKQQEEARRTLGRVARIRAAWWGK
jgi:septal ring factor EnvC (AmiA/AmiB activator)